jgi:hypothetical protein
MEYQQKWELKVKNQPENFSENLLFLFFRMFAKPQNP